MAQLGGVCPVKEERQWAGLTIAMIFAVYELF